MVLWRCCAIGILLAAGFGASANDITDAAVSKSGEAAALTLPEEPPSGGEAGEEGGETKEEKKEEARIDMGISLMLLGSITFMMILFYLVNHKDEDFVYYSWSVISSTISIFSAVLLFQAFDGMLNYLVIGLEGMEEEEEKGPGKMQLILGFGHMFFWFMMLQFTLAHISGAIDLKIPGTNISIKGWKSKEDEEQREARSALEEEEIKERKEAEEMAAEVDMKCFAVLLGHITGFASISAFGNLQQILVGDHGMYKDNVVLIGFSVPLLAWVYTRVLGMITDHIRERVSKGDDGILDEAEELWDEETEETEDDVVGLCISFLVIQVTRYMIGGHMPNAEGEEEGEPKHKTSESLMLAGTGVVWVFVLLILTQHCMHEEGKSRLRPQMRNVIGMCFAWCLYFSVDWAISYNLSFESPMMEEVALALAVSGVALSCIRLLDWLADLDWTKKPVDDFIRKDLIVAMGILIGFSWEKNFDIGVTTIANNLHHHVDPPVTKLLMALVLAAIVIPAWWKFILPTKIQHEKELEAAEEAKEHAEKAKEHAEKNDLEEPLMKKGKPVSLMTPRELKDELRGVQKKLVDRHRDIKKMERDLHEQRRVADVASTHIKKGEDLEKKNKELEACMEALFGDIQELQKIADSIAT